MDKKQKYLLAITIGILILVTLFTSFLGGADVYDYVDVSKFFAGEYDAKIRTSHSYLYGIIHTPFVMILQNFFIFKITSIISLLLIIYSIYWMTKDERALWLMLLSPIVWYMAPWASPIQLSSLIFLWGWYFIKKYDSSTKNKDDKQGIKYLFYSGVLMGIAWAFWDAILFFIPLLIICFFYDKKLTHAIYFLLFILIGALPRFILDQILFGFAFFNTVRHIFASLALTFLGGFYEQGALWGVSNLILLIIFFPVFTYSLYKKKVFIENKKSIIFISLSIILLILNSQIRFVLLITPIIILITSKYLTKKKYIIQLIISLVLILLVLNPYILQIKFEIGDNDKGIEFSSFIKNINSLTLNEQFQRDIIKADLQEISGDYPDELFVVGNFPDDYRFLANIYFGDKIIEFVSIEDYKLNFEDPIVSKKEICTHTKIDSRRDFCFSVFIRKAFQDSTDYDSIKYGLSFEDNLDIEGFQLLKEYEKLNVFQINQTI